VFEVLIAAEKSDRNHYKNNYPTTTMIEAGHFHPQILSKAEITAIAPAGV